MNWRGGLLTPYFSSLIPVRPLTRIKEHTCFPEGHKLAGKPARPGVEKPVALLGNDIIMYGFFSKFLLITTNNILFRTYKPEVWSKLIVVDLTQGAGSTGEAALKLGCLYIGNDIDPDMKSVCNERFKNYKEWQAKPPSFWIEEWRKDVGWDLFTKGTPVSEEEIVEVDEEKEGIYTYMSLGLFYINIILKGTVCGIEDNQVKMFDQESQTLVTVNKPKEAEAEQELNNDPLLLTPMKRRTGVKGNASNKS